MAWGFRVQGNRRMSRWQGLAGTLPRTGTGQASDRDLGLVRVGGRPPSLRCGGAMLPSHSQGGSLV